MQGEVETVLKVGGDVSWVGSRLRATAERGDGGGQVAAVTKAYCHVAHQDEDEGATWRKGTGIYGRRSVAEEGHVR